MIQRSIRLTYEPSRIAHLLDHFEGLSLALVEVRLTRHQFLEEALLFLEQRPRAALNNNLCLVFIIYFLLSFIVYHLFIIYLLG